MWLGGAIIKQRIKLICLVGFWWLMAYSPMTLALQVDDITSVMYQKIESIRYSRDPKIHDVQIASVALLPDFYLERGYYPAWRPASIQQFLDTVRRVEEHGLDPEDYHYSVLKKLMATTSFESLYFEQRCDLDIVLTDSLIRLSYHLIFGKVNPKYIDENWNITHRTINNQDPVEIIQEIVDSPFIYESTQLLAPQQALYHNLKNHLSRYKEIKQRGGWPSVAPGPTLRLGQRNARIAVLRQRLRIEYGIPTSDRDPMRFDIELEQAVKYFQKHHFIEADGLVGRKTLEALNISVQQRIDQIRVNLERARWVMHALKGRFIVIDIAGYEVTYFYEGQPEWRARAVVGQPFRETPVFRDKIRYIEFNPTWTIPPTIFAEDILPKVKKNPNYLKRKKIRVYGMGMKEIDPNKIKWSRYTSADGFPYILRQDPGPRNTLGQVKFMFPNKHSVYLHDTPTKRLFEKTERTFSSGCIRVERPFELAELLLDDMEKWDQKAIMAIVARQKTTKVDLAEPVPVLLLYWTVKDNQGEVLGFKQDIYQRDNSVLEVLNSPFLR